MSSFWEFQEDGGKWKKCGGSDMIITQINSGNLEFTIQKHKYLISPGKREGSQIHSNTGKIRQVRLNDRASSASSWGGQPSSAGASAWGGQPSSAGASAMIPSSTHSQNLEKVRQTVIKGRESQFEPYSKPIKERTSEQFIHYFTIASKGDEGYEKAMEELQTGTKKKKVTGFGLFFHNH